LSRFREFDEAAAFNDGKNTDFWITQSDTITPLHQALETKSREGVEAFYDARSARVARVMANPAIARSIARLLRRLRLRC
jgi:hypothetical protein